MMELQLSESQRRTAATAVTVLSVAVIVGAVAALFWMIARFFATFSNVFLPLAVAGVLALVLNPWFEWLRRRMPAPLALAVLFLSLLIPVVGFFWFFGALVAEQISDMVDRFPVWWRRMLDLVQDRWPQVVRFFEETEAGQQIREAVSGQGGTVVRGLQLVGAKVVAAGAGVAHGIGSFLAWVVLPIYLIFFLLADAREMRPLEDWFPFLKPETRKDFAYLLREFVRIVVTFFRGQLIVAFLQGVLFATGFSIVGLDYGFVLGLVLGFLNIIPYLGSIIGLGVALPLALFQSGGGWWLVGAVIAVFTVVQMIEAYLLTPRIMGERTGLHPMAVIVAIFFWGTALNGIMGMILAIPLTAFLVVLWRLAEEKYFREWV